MIWQLAIFVDRLLVPFPGRAAQRAASTEGFVGPLVEDPDRERVHLWVSGVVLVTNATGIVTSGLVADPDPFQPNLPSGRVLRAGLDPRHVLFATSGFGVTVGEIVWDDTALFTPPEIVARGHDAAWRGVSISDATLYLPRDLPFVGDVTAGVRDLLIGRAPNGGVQLEAFVQMGEISRLDPDDGGTSMVTMHFYQDVDGQIGKLDTPTAPPPGHPWTEREVVATTSSGNPIRVIGRLAPPEVAGRWRLPGTSTWITANDTGWLTVRPGDPHSTLGYRDIFALEDGGEADGPQLTFAFVPEGAADLAASFPPKIVLTVDSEDLTEEFSWTDVASVSGAPSHLAGMRFDAVDPLPDDPGELRWELRHDGSVVTGSGGHFEPNLAWRTGRHWLVLTDGLERHRRMEIEVIADADRMIIGCAFVLGVGTEDERRGPRQLVVDDIVTEESPATPIAVIGTYHLRSFHQDGEFRPGDEPPTLNPLIVADGTLAELALAAAEDADAHVLAAMRVRMDFDTTIPILFREIHPAEFESDEAGFEGTHVDPWGPPDPYPLLSSDASDDAGPDRLRGFPEGADPTVVAASVLRAWANVVLAADPDAEFVVIGRTCDIGDSGYNTGLGGRRAEQGAGLLTDVAFGDDPLNPPVPTSKVFSRGENQPPIALPGDPTILDEVADPELRARSLGERTRQEIRIEQDYPERSAWGESRSQPERQEARCVDLYAVVPSQAGFGIGDPFSGARRRTLVAGADQWAVITELPRERDLSFALRFLAKWDSPTWVDAQDSAPTLVEVAFEWENASLEVPELGGSINPEPAVPGPGDTTVWQVLLRYTRDPFSRQMTISGALDTAGDDTGIARIVDTSDGANGIASDLALALALGPALGTAIDPSDSVDGIARLASIVGVATASAIFDVASNGTVTLEHLEFGYGRAAGGIDSTAARRIWLFADYRSAFDVAIGRVVSGSGIEIRYRGAGIEFGDNVSTSNLDDLGIVYEDAPEIVSPGTWTMSSILAKLLGVAAVRMGAGSIWIEVDLVLALNLGPVRLEEATLRLTLSDPVVFELRGLTLSVDIPGVIHGEGHLAITENGSEDADEDALDVSASVDLAIEPIGLGIEAAFWYSQPLVHLEVVVTFATPIPLLNTGLGLFGLNGRFVSNGTRNLPSAEEQPDPVQRELAWLETSFDHPKYVSSLGQTAIGLGATVGTQPDGGFTFNVNGMIVVEMPDPSVVLTVAGTFMALPPGAAEDATAGSTTGAGLLGIVAISGDGIAVGIRGTYGIPMVLDVQVPVAAWFPFNGAGADGYVRVGCDGYGTRIGDRVTITVFPGTLDILAWAFLMIEQKQMLDLGGKGPDWDFTGFSIGFGAGYDFEWGGKTVYLRAGSSIVVGLGTKPLFIKGELECGGELRFGPVGVSIDGLIGLTLTEQAVQLVGEFCGEVDLALFKAKGCVSVTINSAVEPTIEPDPLIAGLSLSDRYARVVGAGRDTSTAGSITAEHRGWVDVRPTLHFNKRVLSALSTSSIQPTPSNGWGADWGGSARTKFLYRLTAVELQDESGGVVDGTADWPSTWWMPAGRAAFPVEGEAPSSEHEMWDLALLAWDPAPWARSLLDGGAGSEGDPATMIERLCDPVPPTTRHCVFGADGVRIGPKAVRFTSSSTGVLPWRSSASLTGDETIGLTPDAASTWARSLGYRYTPSAVSALPQPLLDPDTGTELTAMWWLPRFTHDTAEQFTTGFDGTYTGDVVDPDLVVAVSLPVPPSGDEVGGCIEFDELAEFGDGDPDSPPLPEVIDYGIVRFSGHSRVDFDSGDDSWCLYFDDQLDIDIGSTFGPYTYGPANRVVATVEYYGTEPIQMRAFAADGRSVEVQQPPGVAPGTPYTLRITHAGIVRVELWADPGIPGIDRVLKTHRFCFEVGVTVDADAYAEMLTELLEESATLLAPVCTGQRAAGDEVWPPVLLEVMSSPERVAAIVRYAPVGVPGPWSGVELSAVPVVDVGIISSCFTTSAAAEAAAATDDAKQDVLDQWNDTWNSSLGDRVVLLDADATYRVEVRYDVATWRQDDVGGPPSAASLDWDDPPATVTVSTGNSQVFEFATAADTAMDEADLLRFEVQDKFDPRALARYVVGFDPLNPSVRHFLDDKILVHFEVEWVEALLDRYGYDLSLAVVRTDPPPGTSRDIDDRMAAIDVLWSSNTSTMQSSPVDARTAVAALLAPCVDGPQPHGVTACLATDDLEPLAEYDVVVSAVARSFPNRATTIARAHFATSRVSRRRCHDDGARLRPWGRGQPGVRTGADRAGSRPYRGSPGR